MKAGGDMNQNNNELKHYGVLGMRWGVRKAQYDSAGRKRPKNLYISKDSKKATNIRKKNVNQMSNQELKDVNKRLQLEREYSNLTHKKSVGEKAVKTFIGVAGTIIAVETAAKTYKRVAEYAVDKLGKKVVG